MIRLRARRSQPDTAVADVYPVDAIGPDDHEAHAAGELCGRCHATIGPADEVRRNVRGEWVHTCC